MEEVVEVIHCDEEQIVASRATDHGRNRRSVSACAMRSRSWRLVPQIMEEIVEVSEVPQLQSSTEFGDEMKAVGQFLTHFASFFALLRLSRS